MPCFGSDPTSDEDIMSKLTKITTLQHLDICHHAMYANIVCQFVHLKNLESLTFFGPHLTPECFAMICENLVKLEELKMKEVHQLTDEDGKQLHRLKKLKRLKFSGASRVTDSFFIGGLGSPAVEHLDIEGGWLTDLTLISIGNCHPHLEYLRIQSGNRFTDAGLHLFLARTARIRTLILESTTMLTDRSLRALATLSPRLSSLCIWSAYNLTSEAVSELRRLRPAMKIW